MRHATELYRRTVRAGPLSRATKLFQGLGAVPDTVMSWAFSTFILLYYNQILGLDSVLVSVALALAIVVDAFVDPVVATLSDNLASPWGRRHPLMLAGAVPFGLATFAVFAPPGGLGRLGLFAWLTGFVLLAPAAMSLFFVPWVATAAELSDDHDERTTIMAWRYAAGWTLGVAFPVLVYSFVMPSTKAHPLGQLVGARYPLMGACAGALATAFALASTLLTLKEIPYLRQPARVARAPVSKTPRELGRALANPTFALVFAIVLISSAIGGVTANIGLYMTTFFWGLTTADLRWFALAGIGAAAAFPFIALVQRRWEKRDIVLVTSWISLLDGMAVVACRFLHLLPKNGDPWLLVILVADAGFAAVIAVIQGVISASVMADILDEHELKTGFRQEGMFFAATAFSTKAVSGLGIILGGLVLKIVALPPHAVPGHVPAAAITRLGVLVGLVTPLFYAIPIWLIGRYRLTRARHAEIQAALAHRSHGAQPYPQDQRVY